MTTSPKTSKETDTNTSHWDTRCLELTDHLATWSKDPSRGVGAVIVDDARRVCATGFNGLPEGVEDRPERLERPAKYDLIVHAEMNAITQCARHGVSTVGTTIYTSFFPCNTCTLAIIQSGIRRVVAWAPGDGDEHWAKAIATSVELLTEAGVAWEQIDPR